MQAVVAEIELVRPILAAPSVVKDDLGVERLERLAHAMSIPQRSPSFRDWQLPVRHRGSSVRDLFDALERSNMVLEDSAYGDLLTLRPLNTLRLELHDRAAHYTLDRLVVE